MYEVLLETFQHPLILAALILLGTYILEDAAIVSAALLSADGLIPSELAFAALFLGIFTGDLGLYGLGLLLTRFQWLERFLKTHAVDRAGIWLKDKMVVTVLMVRLIPGLRLPVYTACGFFRLSFICFLLLVLAASLLWTAAIFYGFYAVGAMFWADLGTWKWILLPVIALLIMYGHKALKPSKGTFG